MGNNYNTYLKYIAYIYNCSDKKIYTDNLKAFFISLKKCGLINMKSIEEVDSYIRIYKEEGLLEIKKDFFKKSFYIDKVKINLPSSTYNEHEVNVLNSFINRIF